MDREFYKIFPARLREPMLALEPDTERLTELRFRAGGPVMLYYGRKECFLSASGGYCCLPEEARRTEHLGKTAEDGRITDDWLRKAQSCHSLDSCRVPKDAYYVPPNELKEMMEYISNYSLYAYEEEVRQGFLTIQGGHRIGFCGRVVMAEGGIRTIRHISFLNIRLAHEKKGCGEKVLPYLFCSGRVCHTLIISPPGCGKTTLLRDLVRLLSDGSVHSTGKKVGVVDERSELAACYHGIPQNDVGLRTDVLDCCPKPLGIALLLRSMSPEIIAVDEIGTKEDADMILRAVHSGCSILATAHGDSYEAWRMGGESFAPGMREVFDRYVFLSAKGEPGRVEAVCDSMGRELFRW